MIIAEEDKTVAGGGIIGIGIKNGGVFKQHDRVTIKAIGAPMMPTDVSGGVGVAQSGCIEPGRIHLAGTIDSVIAIDAGAAHAAIVDVGRQFGTGGVADVAGAFGTFAAVRPKSLKRRFPLNTVIFCSTQ